MKTLVKIVLASAFSLAVPYSVAASYSDNNDSLAEHASFSEAQLAQLLAPIALYPDSLLSHILIASTYPIEVIEAQRWQENHQNLSEDELQEQAEDKDWDLSVKALLPFGQLLKTMSDDLTWLQQLGDAFLADEAQVLASIQTLRQQAYQAGNLPDNDNVSIEHEQENIVIVTANPKVIYVPYYDTRKVYGYWRWHNHPPIFWQLNHNRYYHNSPVYWHAGVHIGASFFFSAFHWHHRYLVVNHHRNYWKKPFRKRHHIINQGYTKRWHHKPHHRRGVAYRSERISAKYKSIRPAHAKVLQQRNKARLVSHVNKPASVVKSGRKTAIISESRKSRRSSANRHSVVSERKQPSRHTKVMNNFDRQKNKVVSSKKVVRVNTVQRTNAQRANKPKTTHFNKRNNAVVNQNRHKATSEKVYKNTKKNNHSYSKKSHNKQKVKASKPSAKSQVSRSRGVTRTKASSASRNQRKH